MKRLATYTVSAILAFTPLYGCNITDAENEYPDSFGSVRIAHVTPDADSVDYFMGDEVLFSSISPDSVSNFIDVRTGVRNNGLLSNSDTLFSSNSVFFEFESRYTTFVIPDTSIAGNARIRTLEHNLIVNPDGNAKLRFLNAVQGAPEFDIYVTDPGLEDLSGEFPNWNEFSYNHEPEEERPRYQAFPPGVNRVRIMETGTSNVLFDEEISLDSEVNYTAVIRPNAAGDAPASLFTITDN